MFSSLFSTKKNYFGTKTFTFYLPAPPERKTGYQEKEFDSVMSQIFSLGFEVIDIKTASHSTQTKGGVWLICLLGAPTKEIFAHEIQFDGIEGKPISNYESVPMDPDIIHE